MKWSAIIVNSHGVQLAKSQLFDNSQTATMWGQAHAKALCGTYQLFHT